MKRILAITAILLVITITPVVASEKQTNVTSNNSNNSALMKDVKSKTNNGWVKEAGKYFYYQDGKASVGWKKIGQVWYYFESNGNMAVGWKRISNNWYYLNADGNMAIGWKHLNGYWYYLNEDGAMARGWKYVDNHWYYLYPGGSMAKGWLKRGDTWYFLNKSGDMATGWIKTRGYWYLLGSNGSMAKGWEKTNNHWWYLNRENESVAPEGSYADGVTDAYYAAGKYSYRYGGCRPSTGFDCSGFVMYYLGLNARTAAQQKYLGTHKYDVKNAPTGSIVFYGSKTSPHHVAISMGDGTVVHAVNESQGVRVTPLNYTGKAAFYVVPGKY